MMLESPKNGRRVLAFLVLMVASLVGLLLLPPISQDQNYHDFADQRTILGMPHFWNVVSNLPFEELRRRSLINDVAQAADKAPDFSDRIRASLPTAR